MTPLIGELDDLRARFENALPIRHVVIDEFLDDPSAQTLHADFPPFVPSQQKAALALGARAYGFDASQLKPSLCALFNELGDAAFTGWLRELTGVDDSRMDPDNIGGGVHQGARGSELHVHADHNTHPNDPTQYRRFNVLIYLNPRWTPAWGGELELWDPACSRVEKMIEPRFNRCVIMEVHDRAFHGYRRLRFPSGETRESLAAYFYSAHPAALQAEAAHGTTFGCERDEDFTTRTASHIRRVLLARIFSRLQGLEPYHSRLRRNSRRIPIAAPANHRALNSKQ